MGYCAGSPDFVKTSSGKGGYAVRKQGDATVVLVGPPSAGKSTLINKLTNAESKVAPYAFTTVTVIPGMLKYRNAYIQILDVPGLLQGAQEGKGRGKEVLSVVRGSDLLIIMTDPERIKALDTMTTELENAGIRINKRPPHVRITKMGGGGLSIQSNIKQELDKLTIREVAWEYGIKNGEIALKEKLNMEIANIRAELAGTTVKVENYESKLKTLQVQKQELEKSIRDGELSLRELQKDIIKSTKGVQQKDIEAKKKKMN